MHDWPGLQGALLEIPDWHGLLGAPPERICLQGLPDISFWGRRNEATNIGRAFMPDLLFILPLWGRCPAGAERASRFRNVTALPFPCTLFTLDDFSTALPSPTGRGAFACLTGRGSLECSETRVDRGFWVGTPETLINKGLAGRCPETPYLQGPQSTSSEMPNWRGIPSASLETAYLQGLPGTLSEMMACHPRQVMRCLHWAEA